jgi:prephenate dehydratase
LTKIESRPSKGWLGDYVFLIDFEGHQGDALIAPVLDRVTEACSMVKIFGSYPRFPLESLRAAIENGHPIDL